MPVGTMPPGANHPDAVASQGTPGKKQSKAKGTPGKKQSKTAGDGTPGKRQSKASANKGTPGSNKPTAGHQQVQLTPGAAFPEARMGSMQQSPFRPQPNSSSWQQSVADQR